ncbi:sialoadhesin-like [Hoplias malabaricus]|uniref:sialoadhesin-like n=1 Tax=Hoplias malabaricus TaxID=27720 RepID=UPI0034620020
MARLLLLHLILNGVLFSVTWAWSVNMPRNIQGLHGSCLVIPCSFSYSYSPPTNPDRIVWYQYVSRGYPLVYDGLFPEKVIGKFRGKTSLYLSKEPNKCSLLIKDLDQSHHEEKIYTWIDPEHVGSSTYHFYDVTSTILIKTSAERPSIHSFGGSQIGETITVQCSTSHTCPANKPTLTLSGIENKEGTSDKFEDDDIGDGKWKITLIRKGILKSDNQRFDCIVNHPGGLSASATKEHTGKWYEELRMETIGLYVLTPLFICLLLCAVAGVVIYRKRKESRPVSGV